MLSGLEKLPHQVANKLNRLRFKSRDSNVAQDSTKRNRNKNRKIISINIITMAKENDEK